MMHLNGGKMSRLWFATFQHVDHQGGNPATFHTITRQHPILELEEQMQDDRKKENRYQSDIALMFYKEISNEEQEELQGVIDSAESNCGEFYPREEEV